MSSVSMCTFNPSFLFPSPLGFPPIRFIISGKSVIVVESNA